ncbi:MAG TPA: hypothetical protein D7I03_01035 [Candidatus Poseidoniales archaeon]|nr:MAG TPA: hypothetical protein D7I03_01035 [Candidatus Poseidoniales archaeon]HII49903.1 hypothetical protein [Candidatus Poseidoniaceae archaeon]
MRQHAVSSSVIVALLISMLFTPIILATSSTISTDTTWSGNIVLEDDVIVSQGTTLTVEPGTTIDGGEGFAIEIYGTLVAESCHFYSSANPTAQSSHGQGLWQGIVVKSGGSATITNVEIENTNVGVKSEGNLVVDNLTVRDSYLGIKNYGTANVDVFYTESIDYEAIMNSGSLTVSNAEITKSSTGIQSSGSLSVTDSNFSEVGAGISANSGVVAVNNLTFEKVSVGFSSSYGVEFSAFDVYGSEVSLLADMANSDDFTLVSANVIGDILAKSNTAINTKLSEISFESILTNQAPVLEQDCSGVCLIENVSITNSLRGVSLTGNGDHIIANSSINAEQYGIRAASQGTLTISNLSITAQQKGIIIRDTNAQFTGENTVTMTSSNSIGLDILGGSHQLSELSVVKLYDSTDSTSMGCQIWYAEIVIDSIGTENFSTGINMRDVDFSADSVSNIGGNSIGTEIIDSEASINILTTKFQNNGIILSENSHLSTYQWIAQLHDQPLQVGAGSIANVLDFTTINTNPSYSDAFGKGAVYYGYNSNLDISSDISDYFVMTNVKFTDMSNNPVEATINVNTFQFTSDENGEVSIPLFSSGSIVQASLLGTGVSETLYGGIQDQSIQIPLIPSGDWIISGNQHISLQSFEATQSFTGDLVINDDAILQITNLDLELASGKVIILNDNAQIIGTNSSIKADSIFVNDASLIASMGSSSNLQIDSDLEWNCQGQKLSSNLFFSQQLSLGSGCHLTIENGVAAGQLTVPTDSSFKITSSLVVSVIDRGLPVSNAVVEFQGADYYTDSSGEVSIESIARFVDSQDDIVGTNENVLLKLDDFNELITWNTSLSKFHQFIVSSLDVSEILSEDVTLETIWSPYYLETDLTIPLGRTMTVVDGVSVRISDGVEISVLGTLDAESAIFSSTGFGDRWSGLVIDSLYSNLHLSGTTLLEASPAISYNGGNLIADDVSISRSSSSRALIEVNEQIGGSFSLTNSQLSDASSVCLDIMESSVELHISNIDFARCNGPSVRAENAYIAMTNITIGEDSSNGLTLSNVNGSVQAIDALEFNGAGSILKLDYINDDLLISDVIGTVGGSPGIAGANNRALNLESINLNGAPAIDFDASAGILSNLTLTGDGYGTGLISHHGRYSDSLRVYNIELSDYAVGIDLHADGPDTTSAFMIDNAVISSSTSLSVEDYPVIVNNASIIGVVEVSGAIVLQLIDTQLDQAASIYTGASIDYYHTIEMMSTYLAIVKPTNYHLDIVYSNGDEEQIQVDGTYVEAIIKFTTRYAESTNDVSMLSLNIIANSLGHPTESQSFTMFELQQLVTPVIFTLNENQPPQINTISPSSTDQIMQTIPFESIIDASDDFDSASAMSYQWVITNDAGSEVYSYNSNNYNNTITLNSPGSYLLKIVVIDSNQAQTEEIIPIEVILLDSDGDYLSTCDDTTWFDLAASRSCGPDVYDDDDDNDGIIDSRDDWPLDACAWQDTDGDGQPDEVNCPEGVVSDLFEDQDDDGDGIPDVLEGTSDKSDGQFNLVTLILLVIGIVVVIMFVVRTRKGLQE